MPSSGKFCFYICLRLRRRSRNKKWWIEQVASWQLIRMVRSVYSDWISLKLSTFNFIFEPWSFDQSNYLNQFSQQIYFSLNIKSGYLMQTEKWNWFEIVINLNNSFLFKLDQLPLSISNRIWFVNKSFNFHIHISTHVFSYVILRVRSRLFTFYYEPLIDCVCEAGLGSSLTCQSHVH